MTAFVALGSKIVEFPSDIISILWAHGANFDTLLRFILVDLFTSESATSSSLMPLKRKLITNLHVKVIAQPTSSGAFVETLQRYQA